ncbi:hypothetical protein [Massilia sp. MP_M2]|uniref:hypothetical protein n=1 Tax=Massilia sp. MP_M2 TaxID=3071713 RepID=UPI00319E224A
MASNALGEGGIRLARSSHARARTRFQRQNAFPSGASGWFTVNAVDDRATRLRAIIKPGCGKAQITQFSSGRRRDIDDAGDRLTCAYLRLILACKFFQSIMTAADLHCTSFSNLILFIIVIKMHAPNCDRAKNTDTHKGCYH